MPVTEYTHGEGCSVTGGFVYRGSDLPELTGQYVYSDFCSGFLASFSDGTGTIDWTDQVGSLGNVTSFGVGGDGELYVLDRSGALSRIGRSG